jgi:hypothetical protein
MLSLIINYNKYLYINFNYSYFKSSFLIDKNEIIYILYKKSYMMTFALRGVVQNTGTCLNMIWIDSADNYKCTNVELWNHEYDIFMYYFEKVDYQHPDKLSGATNSAVLTQLKQLKKEKKLKILVPEYGCGGDDPDTGFLMAGLN